MKTKNVEDILNSKTPFFIKYGVLIAILIFFSALIFFFSYKELEGELNVFSNFKTDKENTIISIAIKDVKHQSDFINIELPNNKTINVDQTNTTKDSIFFIFKKDNNLKETDVVKLKYKYKLKDLFFNK